METVKESFARTLAVLPPPLIETKKITIPSANGDDDTESHGDDDCKCPLVRSPGPAIENRTVERDTARYISNSAAVLTTT